MTERQWLILQVVLLYASNRIDNLPWAAADLPAPAREELDAVVQWLSDFAAPSPNAKLGDWEPTKLDIPAPDAAALQLQIDMLKADQGWDTDSQLLLAERFIESRKDAEGFLHFLSAVADIENGGEDEDDDDADEETLLHIEYTCPKCSHAWSDQWTSDVDAECPQCGEKDISPTSHREADDGPPAAT